MLVKWLVSVWAILCTGGILAISLQQFSEFDPDSTLSLAISDLSFEDNFVNELQSTQDIAGKSLIHFYNGCFCDLLSQAHIKNLSAQMDTKGFHNIHLDIREHPELSHYVPSTPSVAIVGNQHELIYLGPYSEGYGCLQSGAGLIETLMPKITSSVLENSLVITDTKGCYCTT